MKELVIKKTITLNAEVSKVWEALTNPELTKQYMFGSEIVSEWKVGCPVIWKGVSDGKEIVFVKGTIVNIKPGRLLQFTTFDPNAKYEDMPSNYTTVTYELSQEREQTLLSVTQGDFAGVADGEKRYKESLGGWDFALNGLKELVEK